MNGLPEWFIFEFQYPRKSQNLSTLKNQLYRYYKHSLVNQPPFCYTVRGKGCPKGAGSRDYYKHTMRKFGYQQESHSYNSLGIPEILLKVEIPEIPNISAYFSCQAP